MIREERAKAVSIDTLQDGAERLTFADGSTKTDIMKNGKIVSWVETRPRSEVEASRAFRANYRPGQIFALDSVLCLSYWNTVRDSGTSRLDPEMFKTIGPTCEEKHR